MRELSKTETELKKALLIKKACILIIALIGQSETFYLHKKIKETLISILEVDHKGFFTWLPILRGIVYLISRAWINSLNFLKIQMEKTFYSVVLGLFKSSPPEVFFGKHVLKICSIFTGEHSYRNVISIKFLCNFIEITLRRESSPVNLLLIFRKSFYNNTSGGLLLAFWKLITIIQVRNLLSKPFNICSYKTRYSLNCCIELQSV